MKTSAACAAHLDELCARELLQGRARGLDPGKITPDDAGINLADRRDRLTIAMIAHINFFETLVSATKAKRRDVRTVHRQSLEQMSEYSEMGVGLRGLESARDPVYDFRRLAGKPCSARLTDRCRMKLRKGSRSAPPFSVFLRHFA